MFAILFEIGVNNFNVNTSPTLKSFESAVPSSEIILFSKLENILSEFCIYIINILLVLYIFWTLCHKNFLLLTSGDIYTIINILTQSTLFKILMIR